MRSHPTVGVGYCGAHHGEILQGVFASEDGAVLRGLATLPLDGCGTGATFYPVLRSGIRVIPADREKALKAARLALDQLGRHPDGGVVSLESNCPTGWGLGSSTCDVVATIRAVGNAWGIHWLPESLAKLAVAAETASDATMFEASTVLFAQRDGSVIERFAQKLPDLLGIGSCADNAGNGIDTLDLVPPDYSHVEIEQFATLRERLRKAIAHRDVRALGEVATASAIVNDRYLPKPRFDDILAVAKACGAAGVQVAHSGPAFGLLFDPTDSEHPQRMDEAQGCLRTLGFSLSYRFSSMASKSSIRPADERLPSEFPESINLELDSV